MNLTSTEATSRIGRAINRVYRAVTTSIGMQLSRNTTASASTSISSSLVTFTSVEKIDRLYKTASSGAIVELKEVLLGELRGILLPSGDNPSRYAILSHTADGITVQLDTTAATVYSISADVQGAIADLSGTNEPAFPESFHDILVEGTLAQEYRKVERQAFAKEAEFLYQQRLSDLRMWIAKSYLLDIQQGGSSRNTQQSAFNGGGGAGGGSIGSTAQTITALWTFDRDPSAPFAVSSGSAVVTNLNADMVDGIEGATLVVGPASATDNAIARFDGTTGKLIQNSGITIVDGASGALNGTNSGDVTLAGSLDYITLANQVLTRGTIDLATDVSITSEAQGDILYRGASAWSRLGAGTSGEVLTTQGAAANPTWVAAAGGLDYVQSQVFG